MAGRARTGRARWPAVVLLLLATALGCGETSRVDPDATVVIAGAVTAPGGAPLADRPVRLVSGSGGADVALAFLTLGLACAGEGCDDDVDTATTDAQGRYRLELLGRDTQTSFGNAQQQALSVAAAPGDKQVSGASVTARFVVQTEQLALPVLDLVDPALALGSAPGRVGASWQARAGAPYALTFETDDLVPVWQVTTAGTSATVDSRVLEGTAGRAVLSGGTLDQAEGTDVALTWRSPGLGYASSASAPVSRGAACAYGPAVPADACALTDGDLFRVELPPACASTGTPPPSGAPCPPVTTVTVALPDAPADLVVVRGCVGTCAVEASSDGVSFTRVGAVSEAFAAVRLPGSAVRAVRVGLGRDGLREVSVWEPAAAEPGLRPVGGDALDRLRRPYEVGDGGVPLLVVVLAGVLCVLGLVGVGFLAGRRAG